LEALEKTNHLYPASELTLTNDGAVYHLGVKPGDVAKDIILVGDQGRVPLVSGFFDSVRFKAQHREFLIHTGTYHGKEISCISTGIGTDNIDIVLNELDALFNIDLEKRQDKAEKTKLHIVRIGTCGIFQPEIPIFSYLLTEQVLGLDNVAHYYQIKYSEREQKIGQEARDFMQFPAGILPYLTTASEELLEKLSSEKTFRGITATASGFYGPQGRNIRIPVNIPDFNEKLSAFKSSEGLRINNLEMETSWLLTLGKALGHECITICLGLANRVRKEFASEYQPQMKELIQYVLNRL